MLIFKCRLGHLIDEEEGEMSENIQNFEHVNITLIEEEIINDMDIIEN